MKKADRTAEEKENNIDAKVPDTFDEIPGDLDVFVKTKESLFKVKDELSQIPGVVFDNQGEFKRYADGTLALSGWMPIKVWVNGREQVYNHDFEFFTSETNRVLAGATKRTETLSIDKPEDGIRILNLEGLQNQYANNLAFESRVQRDTKAVEKFIRMIGARELTPAESRQPDLPPDEMAEYRKLRTELVNQRKGESEQGIKDQIVRLLSGGLKEKVTKRLRNVEAIAGERSDQPPTEQAPLARAA